MEGDYALEVQTDEFLSRDAGVLSLGRKRILGLAQYCNDGSAKKNNVKFVAKAH